jgi:NADH-quinone oxidoreductase subunit N
VLLVAVIAVLTMTAGNMLGLLQFNVKRVLAYSSVAHSGYLLVGVTALLTAGEDLGLAQQALRGVLFYLAAYGMMNVAAFGVLMLLPARPSGMRMGNGGSGDADTDHPAETGQSGTASAESFDDIAGQGRRHPALGLAMAVSCFSLIGLPMTVGFFGKIYLILPTMQAGLIWLWVILLINAAISAAYYLRIVATMFLRPEPAEGPGEAGEVPEHGTRQSPPAVIASPAYSFTIVLAIVLSAGATVFFGTIPPATELLQNRAAEASDLVERPMSAVAAPPPR